MYLFDSYIERQVSSQLHKGDSVVVRHPLQDLNKMFFPHTSLEFEPGFYCIQNNYGSKSHLRWDQNMRRE